jgi:2'-5' RNA ligase
MRLFLAVDPSPPAKERLGSLLTDLRHELADVADALRWTPSGNVHLTLHFLGEVDESRAQTLRDLLGSTIARPPFTASVGVLGTFPVGRPPATLWVALDAGRESLVDLHRETASRVRAAGLPVESRQFSPHLTLARVRDGARHRVRRLTERLARVRVPAIAWPVDRVTLFESHLSSSAPRYEVLHEILLKP